MDPLFGPDVVAETDPNSGPGRRLDLLTNIDPDPTFNDNRFDYFGDESDSIDTVYDEITNDLDSTQAAGEDVVPESPLANLGMRNPSVAISYDE